MLVIADSSPVIAIIGIGYVNVLPTLFGSVTVPTQVADELASARRPPSVRDFIQNRPAWLTVRSPLVVESIPLLQLAETAAISLVKELNADLLLIDEIQGGGRLPRRGASNSPGQSVSWNSPRPQDSSIFGSRSID
jgi:predicted nucleic acid-binding protein